MAFLLFGFSCHICVSDLGRVDPLIYALNFLRSNHPCCFAVFHKSFCIPMRRRGPGPSCLPALSHPHFDAVCCEALSCGSLPANRVCTHLPPHLVAHPVFVRTSPRPRYEVAKAYNFRSLLQAPRSPYSHPLFPGSCSGNREVS